MNRALCSNKRPSFQLSEYLAPALRLLEAALSISKEIVEGVVPLRGKTFDQEDLNGQSRCAS